MKTTSLVLVFFIGTVAVPATAQTDHIVVRVGAISQKIMLQKPFKQASVWDDKIADIVTRGNSIESNKFVQFHGLSVGKTTIQFFDDKLEMFQEVVVNVAPKESEVVVFDRPLGGQTNYSCGATACEFKGQSELRRPTEVIEDRRK